MKIMTVKHQNNQAINRPITAILTIILMMVAVLACEDIFEKDLEGKEVDIFSPSDDLKTQYTSQNFWWEKAEGALSYNLQIVAPTFENIEKLLVDTNIVGTKFLYTLYPGKFQWRLRPANGSSYGNYVVRSLEIDTTLDLRGQEVILRNPFNDFATNKSQIKFFWDKLYNASDYRFELKNNEWTGPRFMSPVLTQHDTITVGGLTEGIYFWGVQAQNNGSATVFSPRKFIIDKTPPKAPVLSQPEDSAKIDNWPSTFKWTKTPDGGATIYDSLVIATDKTFKAGSVRFSQRVNGQSQQVNLNTTGKYFWKVISLDVAGNTGPWSESNLLIVGTNP